MQMYKKNTAKIYSPPLVSIVFDHLKSRTEHSARANRPSPTIPLASPGCLSAFFPAYFLNISVKNTYLSTCRTNAKASRWPN